MAAIFQPLGALTALLAVWLFLCDHNNDFLPILCALAMLLLGMGVAWE